MINHSDLKYFLEVSNTLHLTRAAERIGISQPALTHCLKRIENELGVSLFTRSKKGVQLTAAGQRLKDNAQGLVEQWEKVMSATVSEVNDVQGTIKIGCHTAVSQYALPHFLKVFLKENPLVDIELTHGLSRHMTEQVVSGKLDIAIAVNPMPNPDLIIREICKDEVSLWQSTGSANKDILIVEPSLLQTQDILRKLAKQGLTFKRVIESASLEVIASFVAEGVGIGVLPERILQSFEKTKYEKVKNSPSFTDRVCLVYKKEFRQLKRGQEFVKTFQEKWN